MLYEERYKIFSVIKIQPAYIIGIKAISTKNKVNQTAESYVNLVNQFYLESLM